MNLWYTTNIEHRGKYLVSDRRRRILQHSLHSFFSELRQLRGLTKSRTGHSSEVLEFWDCLHPVCMTETQWSHWLVLCCTVLRNFTFYLQIQKEIFLLIGNELIIAIRLIVNYEMTQSMIILFGSGVFFLSVMIILCWPPSATLQRYMCRKDLPMLPHLDISTISALSGYSPRWCLEKISFPLISIS